MVVEAHERVNEVTDLHWPADAARRAELAGEGRPRLLIVAEGEEPPVTSDPLEDWVRPSADALEFYMRRDRLRRRAAARAPASIDADGLLHRGDRWVALPPGELAALTALMTEPGYMVARADLAAAARDGRRRGRPEDQDARQRRPPGAQAHRAAGHGGVRGTGRRVPARDRRVAPLIARSAVRRGSVSPPPARARIDRYSRNARTMPSTAMPAMIARTRAESTTAIERDRDHDGDDHHGEADPHLPRVHLLFGHGVSVVHPQCAVRRGRTPERGRRSAEIQICVSESARSHHEGSAFTKQMAFGGSSMRHGRVTPRPYVHHRVRHWRQASFSGNV